MTVALLLAAATDSPGLSDLSVYGVAAFPIALLLWAIRWQHQQMSLKDATIEKLNERLIVQGELAVKQAERLAPLINDASKVLNDAIAEIGPRMRDRSRDDR